MKDIIGTLIIMLLCIAALVTANNPEETAPMPRPDKKNEPETEPSKSGKPKEKPASNYSNDPRFVSPLSLLIFVGSQGIGANIANGFLKRMPDVLGLNPIAIRTGGGCHVFTNGADKKMSVYI